MCLKCCYYVLNLIKCIIFVSKLSECWETIACAFESLPGYTNAHQLHNTDTVVQFVHPIHHKISKNTFFSSALRVNVIFAITFFLERKVIKFVFCILQDSTEHVGEVFQDQRNMAAILMRRQLEHGDLLMVSSMLHFDILI